MTISSFSVTIMRDRRVRRSLFAALVALISGTGAAFGQAGGSPAQFSSPEEAQEFARLNLPIGVHPGDFVTDKHQYPEGDVADVYRAALDALYTTGDKRPAIVVLLNRAEMLATTCYKPVCALVPAHNSVIDTLTLHDFRRATLTRRMIRPDFKYHLPVRLFDPNDNRQLSAIGQSLVSDASQGKANSENPFWVGFMSRYPGAWGMAVLTQVGFNPARTEAILQVHQNCGSYCNSTEMILLRKSNGRWQVAERIGETSQDTDLGHDDLRFRGLGAKRPVAEVRAEQVADSIKKMRLPRSIHGVVTSSPSGTPVALARISVNPGDTANTPWSQLYSDSRGGYAITNPPLGSIVIGVHCPKSTYRTGVMVRTNNADVKPGTDTTMDFAIDMRLCDTPALSRQSPGPRKLTAPPPSLMDSADVAAGQSATLTGEEAAIYTAVINGMASPTPGSVTLVANKTRSLCSGIGCAGDYRQRVRYVPEVILTTLDNFISVREQRLSLRPDFAAQSDLVSKYATRSDVVLIGDSALRYLQSQANFSESAYAASHQGNALGYWEIIHQAYPSANGIVTLSTIGFSPRRKQALVEATRADINGFRVSAMFLLNYVNGEWRIVRLF
jgi:hypothetical protein